MWATSQSSLTAVTAQSQIPHLSKLTSVATSLDCNLRKRYLILIRSGNVILIWYTTIYCGWYDSVSSSDQDRGGDDRVQQVQADVWVSTSSAGRPLPSGRCVWAGLARLLRARHSWPSQSNAKRWVSSEGSLSTVSMGCSLETNLTYLSKSLQCMFDYTEKVIGLLEPYSEVMCIVIVTVLSNFAA